MASAIAATFGRETLTAAVLQIHDMIFTLNDTEPKDPSGIVNEARAINTLALSGTRQAN